MSPLKNAVMAMVLCAAGASGRANAAEVVKNVDYSVNVKGRLQLLGMTQYLDDASRSDARMYMFLKQARVGVDGDVSSFRYKLQLALGGEDEVKTTTGIGLSLLDLYVDVPVGPSHQMYVRAGQFKVPYGRERLLDSGDLMFSNRSIDSLGFKMGRDVGAVFMGDWSGFKVDGGIMVGGGVDVPERYLPQRMGTPMFVLRAGYDHGVGDAFQPAPNEMNYPGLRYGAFVNGFYVKDSLVGHSSVLNVRLGEHNLLTNPAWNPVLAQTPLDKGDLYQVGADGIVAHAMGPGVASLEAQVDTGKYSNKYGFVELTGARAEGAYRYGALQGSLRYAVLFPNSRFVSYGKEITGTQPMQEVTPAVSYQFFDSRLKVIADLPVYLNAPVFNEPGLGSYVAYEQPDQASVLKTGTVERQNVIEGRVQFQAQF